MTALRAIAVAAIAAHDLNEELTILLCAGDQLLRMTPANDPRRPMLTEMHKASCRATWMAANLLNFASRHGARPSAACLSRFTESPE